MLARQLSSHINRPNISANIQSREEADKSSKNSKLRTSQIFCLNFKLLVEIDTLLRLETKLSDGVTTCVLKL